MNEVFINVSEMWIKEYFNTDLVSVEDLIATIEELDFKLEDLKKENEQREEDFKENYVLRNWRN